MCIGAMKRKGMMALQIAGDITIRNATILDSLSHIQQAGNLEHCQLSGKHLNSTETIR